MARTVRFRNSAGTLVLDLSSTGYEMVEDGVNIGGRAWRRVTVSSPFVDGNHEVSSVLDSRTAEVTVRLIGSTWAAVQALYAALMAAVEASSWLLEVEIDGVSEVYRASPADSVAGTTTVEITHAFRTVSLTIPVQPTPYVTGI